MMYLLCNVRGLGETLLTCLASLKPMLDIYLIGALLYGAILSCLLTIRGHANGYFVMKDLFSAVVRQDTNVFPFLESLDSNLYNGTVAISILVMTAFVFTLFYLNLIIGVYTTIYANLQGKATLLHLKHRTVLTCQY